MTPGDTVRLAMRDLADDLVDILDAEPSRERRVELLERALHGAVGELHRRIVREYGNALAVVSVLVEREGGSVRFPRAALLRDRGEILTSDEDKLTNEVVLTLTRPMG